MYGFCFITQINKSVSTIEGELAKTENAKALGNVYESYWLILIPFSWKRTKLGVREHANTC